MGRTNARIDTRQCMDPPWVQIDMATYGDWGTGGVLMVAVAEMISAKALAHGHALSFTDQPTLTQLFSTLKRRRRHLTVVLGAGISMNSSLPSWGNLVNKMSQAVKDPILSEMLRNVDGDSLERRAETTIQIACALNKNIDAAQVIRDALYSEDEVPTPGLLALSIGRLIAQYYPSVSVLTTNFDLIMEDALSAYLPEITVKPYSMDSYDAWLESEQTDSQLGILHLHGVIRQGGKTPLGPIVLTDSDFLKHGASVRAAVSSAIKGGTTLFAGLSLTDPNIVGPLYQATDTPQSERYGLFVPRLYGDDYDPEQYARYALAGAQFLRTKLHLRPILLKSYSQLTQLISELGLAVAEPNLYRRNAPRDQSLHYGVRFKEALAAAYAAVGAHVRTGELNTDNALSLSRKLHESFHSSLGLKSILSGFQKKYSSLIADDENFGIFLWLRSLDAPPDKKYSLRLIGTSVYTHLEAWSARREEAITGNSNYAAVHAIFEGGVRVENLEPSRNGGTWRAAVAVPVVVTESRSNVLIGGDPLDSLTIGAVTLDSNKPIEPSEPGSTSVSVISQLEPHEFQQIVDALDRLAGAVLT